MRIRKKNVLKCNESFLELFLDVKMIRQVNDIFMQKMFTNHKKRQFVLSIWRNMEVEKKIIY